MGRVAQHKMEHVAGLGSQSVGGGMGLERVTGEGSNSVVGGMGLERATGEGSITASVEWGVVSGQGRGWRRHEEWNERTRFYYYFFIFFAEAHPDGESRDRRSYSIIIGKKVYI